VSDAYAALRSRDYDLAIQGFRAALAAQSGQALVHKDLAYALLKTGEGVAAREEFAAAARLDPADHHATLEYAFLAYETGKRREARKVFDRVRREGDEVTRRTAAEAFEHVDRPLREGIARWQAVVEQSPGNFSAHAELARLAEQHDEPALAAEHFLAAWKLKPREKSLLVEAGRLYRELGREEEALTLLLAASRGEEPRAAERARALLPNRYPYVYEFRRAVSLDPLNAGLKRELAYLLLEMDLRPEAEKEFEALASQAPDDLLTAAQLGFLRLARKDCADAMPLLEKVLEGPDEELADRVRTALGLPQTLRRRAEAPRSRISMEAKTLAEKSYAAGYLQDAYRYFQIAYENDPVNFQVMLRLGWTANILRNDEAASRWFYLASRSPDRAIAEEASRAYRNLRPSSAPVRFSAWAFPMFSSRWHDLFAYAQAKTEFRIPRLPLRPYLSVRFVGDTKRMTGGVLPQYLSESAFIFGAGVATPVWKGLTAWAEAGQAISYLQHGGQRNAVLDYRAGASYAKGFGRLLGGGRGGAFLETEDDGVYLSRFGNDFITYSQNRTGYTLPALERFGGFQAQLCWNGNFTADTKREYWANFVETGPGMRFRLRALSSSLLFTASLLRGNHTVNRGNPGGPVYTDFRAGVWYAISH
jgi:tetratricopeptide (TPR) repeat protein